MPLSQKAQDVLTEFGHNPNVSADQLANLQTAINGSPALVDQINSAVANDHLKHFAVLPTGSHAGGSYSGDTKTMNLPLSIMTTPGGGSFSASELTFVLGHEIQHGFNHAATTQAYATFQAEAKQVAKSASVTHDYTPAIGKLIAANRNDEAGAEITGFNALSSQVRQANPHATLKDIYLANRTRMQDFIDVGTGTPTTYKVKANLTLNADMTLSQMPHNIAGMGHNYFDHAPLQAGLGHNGNSDYANYYGAYAVSVVSNMERAYAAPVHGVAPTMTLNMTQLHLSESLVEQNGVSLNGPAGHAPAPQAYWDTSTTPPTPHHFDHTAATHTHTPVAPPQRSAIDPTQVGHPDHALYAQIRDGVQQLDAERGRSPDESSARLTASLLPLAKAVGLSQVDHVVLSEQGESVFLVQGDLDNPAHVRAQMSTHTAVNTPIAESFQQLDAGNKTQQASLPSLSSQPSQSQEEHKPSALTM